MSGCVHRAVGEWVCWYWQVVQRRVDLLVSEGIEFQTGVTVGKDISARQLLDDFDAVVLCLGSTWPRDLNIPGTSQITGTYLLASHSLNTPGTSQLADQRYSGFKCSELASTFSRKLIKSELSSVADGGRWVGKLVGWLTDWLAVWLSGRLVEWQTGCSADWLADRSACRKVSVSWSLWILWYWTCCDVGCCCDFASSS